MKLKQRQNIITNGSNSVTEIGKYSICEDSMDVIFDILRSKMYASPIRAIMQEVASNARDANREAGRGDRPIEIKLPNRLDQSFYIRDFGPGITPDRMSNVFLKYGASTKRDTNDQTGGFGLGAKTPFSYSDTFTIVTVTDKADETGDEADRGRMVKRQYVAMIEETRRGRIDLVMTGEPDADEEQGTTIVLNCKSGDERTFEKWLVNTCKYWNVKPEVKGVSDFEWKKYDAAYEGAGWHILEREKNYYGGYDSDFSKPYALVDGIPYVVKSEYVFGNEDIASNMRSLFNFPLRMKFKVGEIELSSTREDIQYTQHTINRIKVRMHAVLDELQKLMKKKIAKSKNLWEAHLEWRKICNTQENIISDCSWKGYDVNKHANFGSLSMNGIHIKQFRKQSNAAPKMKSVQGWDYIGGPNSSVLALDDTGNKIPSKGRITTLLNDNPSLDVVWTITVSDWDNGLPKNDPKYQSAQGNWKELKEHFNLDQMGVVNLSTVEPTKAQRAPRVKGASTPVVIKKFRKYNYGSGYSSCWEDTQEGDIKLSDSGRVYVLIYNRTAYLADSFNMKTKLGTELSNGRLADLRRETGVDIYGVPMRYIKKIGNGWVSLEKYVSKEVAKLAVGQSKDMMCEVEDYCFSIHDKFGYVWDAVKHSDFLRKLDNKQGTMAQYIQMSHKVSKFVSNRKKIKMFNAAVGEHLTSNRAAGGKSQLETLYASFVSDYPLLTHINNWSSRSISPDEIAFYVNSKDRAKYGGQ